MTDRGQTLEPAESALILPSDMRFACRRDAGCCLDCVRLRMEAAEAYPLRFVQTPDGIAVGLSFGCSGVCDGGGLPLVERFDELRAFAARPEGRQSIQDPIRFDPAQALEWEEYKAIERALDEILGREEEKVETCLVAGHVWLGMLRQMLAIVRVQPPGPGVPTAAQTVAHYTAQTRQNRYERAFRTAHRPVGNRAVKRMLLGSFASFRATLRPRQWRLTVMARLFAQYWRHWLRLGSVRLVPLAHAVPYGRFRPTPDDFAEPASQALLRRYFRHALFRKDLIVSTDLFSGYCYLVLICGLAQWYAAAIVGAGEPSPARALSLVEKYYVHHVNFGPALLYHPALADVLQIFFRRPNFAHTIIFG